MGSNITMVVTSCGRHDLLKQTLDSFVAIQSGGLKPDACIIIEDSDTPKPDWLNESIYTTMCGKITWLQNEVRMGQIYSIDRAYAEVQTDFIFHCEDDWLFAQPNFMAESKDILSAYPNVLMVSLRGGGGWHPLVKDPRFSFKIAQPNWRGGWGGIAFNPGLRRLADYKKIGSYGRHVSYGTHGLGHEMQLSKMHLDMGFVIADLDRPIVVHTGGGRSRAIEPLPDMPKILIAIPVCHKFEYTRWESEQSPRYDKSRAWENRPYGTDIHISGENNRIAALRETWLRDVAPFAAHVDYKLFYGMPHDRESLPDEVFLGCPDDYAGLPRKTVEICKYAFEHGYDWVFKADDDSYVWVDRLISELMMTRCDYGGWAQGTICSGGPGYWLSKRAMKIVAEQAGMSHWAEDCTVGITLSAHRIKAVMLSNHHPGFAQHWFDIDNIPANSVCIHALQPDTMRELYRREH